MDTFLFEKYCRTSYMNWLRQLFGLDPLFGGVPRSPEWPRVRAEHLKMEPACVITGETTNLEVHHIRPYHLHPELELVHTNLVTLTTKHGSLNVHLWFGHFGNFKDRYNINIREDAPIWKERLIGKMEL